MSDADNTTSVILYVSCVSCNSNIAWSWNWKFIENFFKSLGFHGVRQLQTASVLLGSIFTIPPDLSHVLQNALFNIYSTIEVLKRLLCWFEFNYSSAIWPIGLLGTKFLIAINVNIYEYLDFLICTTKPSSIHNQK